MPSPTASDRPLTTQGAHLQVSALDQRAGGKKILEGITLAVLPGECVGLLGPSGSGKSTLLKACCGLTRPTHGVIQLDGQDLHQHRDAWRKRIGYVPQDDIIHTELTVERALTYAARLRLPRQLGPKEIQAAVSRAIAQVGLSERAEVRIGKLSGGQRKRASVAVELLSRPSILFLDEPTSGQDPHLEEAMMKLFRSLAAGGTTVMVTTHAMANIELLDLVAIVQAGRLVYFGPPQALLDFFETRSYEGVFKRLAAESPAAWQQRFRQTPFYQEYVLSRLRKVSL